MGMAIKIELDAEEGELLIEALEVHLSEFRREVAGTENPTFRHALQRKQNFLERFVEDLRQRSAGVMTVRAG